MSGLRWVVVLGVSVLTIGNLSAVFAQDAEPDSGKTFLHKNWQLPSSCEVKARGEQISTVGFDAGAWHKTDVPSTVVGALVNDKTYPDPNYGKNFK
jgi:hypothetical protein